VKRGGHLTRHAGATPFTTFRATPVPMVTTAWLSSRSSGTKPRPTTVHPRLRPRSKKTAKVYREQRIPLVVALLAEHPECQIQWDDGCTRQAVDVHELLSRGRGGSIVARENCVTGCRHCHDKVTQNPAGAEKRGFLLKSGRPSKAVPRG
jgi:hypothetical protein